MIRIKRLKSKKIIAEESLTTLKSKDFLWADIITPSEQELANISSQTAIPIQYFKEYLKEDAKPAVYELRQYTFLVVNAPQIIGNHVKTNPLIVVLSKHFHDFVTIHNQPVEAIQIVNAFPEQNLTNIFAKGPTYVFYILIDEIIKSYFDAMDVINRDIDLLEDDVFKNKNNKTIMQEIHETKKALIFIHRALIANREVLTSIENEYSNFFTKEDLKKFRVLYTDINQLVDLSLTYRDILSSSVEVYLSNISNNLNVIMKKLTAWAAIILVPALVAGVYGMNFEYLPELHWKYGYFFALGVMLSSVLLLYLYFKKKDWL